MQSHRTLPDNFKLLNKRKRVDQGDYAIPGLSNEGVLPGGDWPL
jgi:hypothetical protein